MKKINKVYIVIILIIIGISFAPMITHNVKSSKDTTSTSQETAQNDNNSTSTDQNNDSSTNTQQDNNATSETDNNTATQTETVQHPNTSGKLTSSDGNLELENDASSDGKVLGTIKNLSSNAYSYVEVDINFYDNNGNQVDSTLTNMNNLEPNGTWKFSAPILNQDTSKKYRVVSIEANR